MKIVYKILLILAIITILCFLIRRHILPSKISYLHKRTRNFVLTNKDIVIKMDTTEKPLKVYMKYHDIDAIPVNVIKKFRNYCGKYIIEIYNEQQCENLIYDFFGKDALQLYRELDKTNRDSFWCMCILYINGGYYLNIEKDFIGNIIDIPMNYEFSYICKQKNKIIAMSSRKHREDVWAVIAGYFRNNYDTTSIRQITIKTKNHENFPMFFPTSVHELIYRHNHLPDTDKGKIDIPVLYINMDDHEERRKFIENQLYNIPDVIRIPGVVANDPKNHPLPRHTITNGEIGCALAHRNAWQTFVNHSEWDKVLILEDDACLKLSSRWGNSLSQLQSPVFLAQGATGYILDRNTAKYLLEKFQNVDNIDVGIDSWMWNQLGMDKISKENFGYSNKIDRRCDTLYYIYTYNAEEKVPTSIKDRVYGTNVREHYCEIANSLIKASRQINIMTIDKESNVSKTLSKPCIAILNFHSDYTLVDLLIKNYNDRFILEIYNGNTCNESSKNIRFFDLDISNIHEDTFDKIIQIGNSYIIQNPFKNIVLDLQTLYTSFIIDNQGFPTIRNVRGTLPVCFTSNHVEKSFNY